MSITLRKADIDDIQKIWQMQVEAFSGLLDKYRDYDLSPAAEDAGRIRERFDQPETTYFFISAEGKDVGVIRVVDKKDGSRKRIRGKGYAQDAILAVEKIYGAHYWELDTILQEEGNLHLYAKMGYHQTGRIEHINDRMDIVFYEKD